MRISKKDLKQGVLDIRIETPDDLWTLKSTIEPGDTLRGSTERKLKLGAGKEEKQKVVRKRVTLTITVEKVEYAPDGGALRVLGTITDGPEDVPRGEHHSFSLEPNSRVSITKVWPQYLLKRLEESRPEEPLLVLLFDREEARLYTVTRSGVQETLRLKGAVAKKDAPEQQVANFYKEIATELQARAAKTTRIIAGAPAFWREYLEKELPVELKPRVVFTTISAVEQTAIRELLGRPEVAKLIAEHQTLRELELVEQALAALAKEKLAYGSEHVQQAVETGNVAQLLVTEHALAAAREDGSIEGLEGVMRDCEAARGIVHLLASDEAQAKIDPLGGVVALQRW